MTTPGTVPFPLNLISNKMLITFFTLSIIIYASFIGGYWFYSEINPLTYCATSTFSVEVSDINDCKNICSAIGEKFYVSGTWETGHIGCYK